MSLRYVRLPQQDKEHLIRLKTKAGINQWNVLCRWALAVSLREPTPITPLDLPADSNVEMTWEVFGGEHADLWLAALRVRCQDDGLPTDDETLAKQLKLHLHRGINYLFAPGAMRNLPDLCEKAFAV